MDCLPKTTAAALFEAPRPANLTISSQKSPPQALFEGFRRTKRPVFNIKTGFSTGSAYGALTLQAQTASSSG